MADCTPTPAPATSVPRCALDGFEAWHRLRQRRALPGNAGFTLDASTGSGSVHSDGEMVVQGSFDRHHITGKIHGGGPIVRIEPAPATSTSTRARFNRKNMGAQVLHLGPGKAQTQINRAHPRRSTSCSSGEVFRSSGRASPAFFLPALFYSCSLFPALNLHAKIRPILLLRITHKLLLRLPRIVIPPQPNHLLGKLRRTVPRIVCPFRS